MASKSPSVRLLVWPLPVRTPFLFTPPASTHTMFAPMLAIARSIVADAPSPIATTQMTALTPMMMPSEVRLERSLFRARALSAIMGRSTRFMQLRSSDEIIRAPDYTSMKMQHMLLELATCVVDYVRFSNGDDAPLASSHASAPRPTVERPSEDLAPPAGDRRRSDADVRVRPPKYRTLS